MLRNALVAVVVSASVLTVVAAQAPQEVIRVSTLTAADYVEIQQLVSKYAYALDTGAGQGRMFADLFASNGSFQNHKGREALVKFAWQHMPEQGPRYVKHYIMNHVIDPAPQGATGKEFVAVLMIGEGGKPSALTVGGVYHDEYSKTANGWRFQTRKFVASKEGPQPLPAGLSVDVGDVKPLARARAKPTDVKPGTLTAEDYLELQQLVNRYPYALDTGAKEGWMYANLFTPDGVFGRSVGREAIAKMAWQHMPEQGPLYAKHYLVNQIIEPTAEGATGKQYVIVLAIGGDGKPTSITTGGFYEDEYARTAEGWRFKARKFVASKWSRPSTPPTPTPTAASIQPSRSASGSKPITLTPLDHIEIGQLVSKYAYALDSGADNGYMYADLFAPDGVMSSRGRPYQGRDKLAELARANMRGPRAAFHYITNHLIEATPQGAKGKNYLAQLRIGEDGQPNQVSGGGYYEDVYVKTPQGWRFKYRASNPSTAGPEPPVPATARSR